MPTDPQGPSADALPRFIIDAPASADEFDSHGRVATALARAIDGDDRLKIVGLLGGWGSGKSTVIRLVEQRLAASARSTLVFTYDAWQHQSDPHRRSFLENLLGFLQSSAAFGPPPPGQPDWKDRLAELNNQVETTKTVTTPTLTLAGKLFLSALVFLPLGIKLIDKGTYPITQLDDPWPVAMFAIGWVLTVLPLLVAIGFYVAWRDWSRFGTLDFFYKHRHPHQNDSLLSILANKQIDTKRDLKIRSPEPTAIEFQVMLSDIFDALAADKKRLVIVIDNLDRLPAGDAISMWGTIRGMFLGRKAAATRGEFSPVVILPIDAKAIAKASEKDGGDVSGAFMEKTFDVTFFVPPPVLSNWQKYMKSQARRVFHGQISEDDIHACVAIMEWFSAHEGRSVTPRKLNSTINGISTLWMQWRGEGISLAAMAYYVIDQARIDENIRAAVGEEKADLSSFDADWEQSIAAIHFGVSPKEAFQILIEQPLRAAIDTADYSSFRELSGVPGFDRYFIAALQTEGVYPSRAAAMLDTLMPLDEWWVRDAWRRLRDLYLGPSGWGTLIDEGALGLSALIRNMPQVEQAEFIEEFWGDLSSDKGMSLITDQKNLVRVIEIMMHAAKKVNVPLAPMEIDGGAFAYCGLIVECTDRAVLDLIEPTDTLDDIAAFVLDRFADPLRFAAVPDVVRALIDKYGESFPWDRICDGAREAAISGDDRFAPAALKTLGLISGASKVSLERLTDLNDRGVIQGRFARAIEGGREDEVSIALALCLLVRKALDLPPGQSWEQVLTSMPAIVSRADDSFVVFGGQRQLEVLIAVVRSAPSALPFARALASHWISRAGGVAVGVGEVLDNAAAYIDLIPDSEGQTFWTVMGGDEEFWAGLRARPLVELAPLLQLLIANAVVRPKAAKEVRDLLDLLSVQAWLKAAREGGSVLQLVRESAAGLSKERAIAGTLLEALRQLIDSVLTDPNTETRARWFELSREMKPAARATLYRTVRDRLARGGGVIEPVAFLQLGGAQFIADGDFAAEADGLVRHLVLEMLGSEPGRGWLADNAELVGEWVRRGLSATASALKGQLLSLGDAGTVFLEAWGMADKPTEQSE